MDCVAIDFETANGQASSACQLAAVVLRDSQMVAEYCWLIRPPRMYFSPRNISIHGIRPADVRDAPTIEQLWPELSAVIDGQVLLAHNARFDIGVLAASLAAFEIACPDLQFSCTRALARAAWPGRARYGLKPLGDWLGVEFQHHDALEDARTCARIALAIERPHGPGDLAELERRLRVSRGSYRLGGINSPRGPYGGSPAISDRWGFPDRRQRLASVDPAAVVTAAAQSEPLAGKRIVLLGPLRGLDMSQSHALLQQLGAVCQLQIDAATDYVVACGTTLDEASGRVATALAAAPAEPLPDFAAAAASDVASAGSSAGSSTGSRGIRLLSERQFRALLPAGKASVRW